MKYLLDTNAYFAVLKYLAEKKENRIEKIDKIIREECYISKVTEIEIISVIGQYARGQARQIATCDSVMKEAQRFIQKALVHNFKSMDSIILGTAKAYSSSEEDIVVVTADKGLKAGMRAINYPHESLVYTG